MGVTLGVLQNTDNWFGEGDEMVFIDDNTKPAITGTGTEDYFNGAWDFGVTNIFANLYNGAPYIGNGERAGGRYCLYRWHADNPIAFERQSSSRSSMAMPMIAPTASTRLVTGIRASHSPIFRRCLRPPTDIPH